MQTVTHLTPQHPVVYPPDAIARTEPCTPHLGVGSIKTEPRHPVEYATIILSDHFYSGTPAASADSLVGGTNETLARLRKCVLANHVFAARPTRRLGPLTRPVTAYVVVSAAQSFDRHDFPYSGVMIARLQGRDVFVYPNLLPFNRPDGAVLLVPQPIQAELGSGHLASNWAATCSVTPGRGP